MQLPPNQTPKWVTAIGPNPTPSECCNWPPTRPADWVIGIQTPASPPFAAPAASSAAEDTHSSNTSHCRYGIHLKVQYFQRTPLINWRPLQATFLPYFRPLGTSLSFWSSLTGLTKGQTIAQVCGFELCIYFSSPNLPIFSLNSIGAEGRQGEDLSRISRGRRPSDIWYFNLIFDIRYPCLFDNSAKPSSASASTSKKAQMPPQPQKWRNAQTSSFSRCQKSTLALTNRVNIREVKQHPSGGMYPYLTDQFHHLGFAWLT